LTVSTIYTITLRPLPSDVPAELRLRAALKRLLRCYDLRAVSIATTAAPAPRLDTTQSTKAPTGDKAPEAGSRDQVSPHQKVSGSTYQLKTRGDVIAVPDTENGQFRDGMPGPAHAPATRKERNQ
jgi:hypothetical protein